MSPLRPTDVRRAALIKHGTHEELERMVIAKDEKGICLAPKRFSDGRGEWIDYVDLMEDFVISNNGGVSWEPCRREP